MLPPALLFGYLSQDCWGAENAWHRAWRAAGQQGRASGIQYICALSCRRGMEVVAGFWRTGEMISRSIYIHISFSTCLG